VLKAENAMLRRDRVCLDKELLVQKLTIEEQEDELLALRLQHEEDLQAKNALTRQLEDLRKPEKSELHRVALFRHEIEQHIKERDVMLVDTRDQAEELITKLAEKLQNNYYAGCMLEDKERELKVRKE
jgi:hypothetical protein